MATKEKIYVFVFNTLVEIKLPDGTQGRGTDPHTATLCCPCASKGRQKAHKTQVWSLPFVGARITSKIRGGRLSKRS